MIVMPNTEPRTAPHPAVPVDGRQRVADTLTDIAVRLNTRQETTDALCDLIATGHGHRTFLMDRVAIALIAASYADSEQTAQLLDDLAGAATRLERHRATTGHDECCGGECERVVCRRALSRCDDCENGPADSLWEAQNHLRSHLERLRSWPHLLRAAQDTT